MNTIKIRVHHIYDFTKALVSEKFREEVYLQVNKDFGGTAKKGFCYSQEEIQPTRDLLLSVFDNTRVRIVLGLDDICAICRRQDKSCKNPDSVWFCKDLISPFEFLDVKLRWVTIKFLKQRYAIVKKYGSMENCRRAKRLARKKNNKKIGKAK